MNTDTPPKLRPPPAEAGRLLTTLLVCGAACCASVLTWAFGRRPPDGVAPALVVGAGMLALTAWAWRRLLRLESDFRARLGRCEVELRAGEERFRAFMDNGPVVASLKDAAGRFLYVNEPCRRHFGLGTADWLGKTDGELFAPEVADANARRDRDVLATGRRAEFTEDVPTPDGPRRRLVFKFPCRQADGSASVGAMALDVTDRLRAEAALRLRERAIDSFLQGVTITDASDASNPIVYANRGFELLTGYARGDILGRNCRFLQGPGTDPAAIAEVRAAIRERRTCFVEMRNYRKDGTVFWNALSIAPVHDDAGGVTHFVGVQTDVTPFKLLEEQFHQAQKMEAIGHLAGGVAHDFNNLLTIINGCSEVLGMTLPPDAERPRTLAAEILKAGERAANLTRQLLAFSRKTVLQPRVLDLDALVANVEKMLTRLIGEDVRLTTALDGGRCKVRVDPGQIEQVLLNLAVNARDAMPTGGRLTVTTAPVEVGEGPAATRYVRLSVSDTGTGMTPEVKARIFEPFFTTKRPGEGTGLGLATVYGIVNQSGGFLEVRSEPGRGTTFEVYLPLAAGEEAGPTQTPRAPAPRGREVVLLVEDEEAVRRLVRETLAGHGYAVLEAADGAEALGVVERHGGLIDLLMTDVVMPEIGGRELAENLSDAFPSLRVLFMSGYTDDAVVRHGVQEAEVEFLQKPFSLEAMLHKVRAVLDGVCVR